MPLPDRGRQDVERGNVKHGHGQTRNEGETEGGRLEEGRGLKQGGREKYGMEHHGGGGRESTANGQFATACECVYVCA